MAAGASCHPVIRSSGQAEAVAMFEYLWSVWRAIQLGLRLQPEMVQVVDTYPNAGWIVFGVVMAAGISVLVGQSVVLFLNQVKPGRFVLSLLINGLLLVVGCIVWATTVWALGNWLFAIDAHFSLVLKLTGLSYAPLVYGFFVLMPYAGPFIGRVLYGWSFLIMLRAVAYTFQVSFWPALVCVGLGWLLLMLLTATIGRPVVALRNRVWQRVTGTTAEASAQELLQQLAVDDPDKVLQKGEKL
jgi:hypothetical protein